MSGATAIVLARRGSKGLPGKNAAIVAGRPCIEWTLDHAAGSCLVGEIIVSTDDPMVASIAHERGIRVVERPADLATDQATIDDAVRHALNDLERSGTSRQQIVILYANVPVRPSDLTDRALELLTSSGADSVQSVARVGKHHPWWTLRVRENGSLAPWDGETLFHGVYRRQSLPPAHIPDGGVIALTRASLRGDIPGAVPGPHAFLGVDRRAVITNEGDVVDIDTPIDLRVADAILSDRARDLHRSPAL